MMALPVSCASTKRWIGRPGRSKPSTGVPYGMLPIDGNRAPQCQRYALRAFGAKLRVQLGQRFFAEKHVAAGCSAAR